MDIRFSFAGIWFYAVSGAWFKQNEYECNDEDNSRILSF